MVILSPLVIIGSVQSAIPYKATKGSSAQTTPNVGINCVVDFILHLQMLLITATFSLIAVSIVTLIFLRECEGK